MRIANLHGRAVLVRDGQALDIEKASAGKFGPAPLGLYEDWDTFRAWAEGADYSDARPYDENELDAPVPNPRQIFAIGLNYKDHADEAGLPYPEHLFVFTKFQSSIAGPRAVVELPSEAVDYEVELVAVIGKEMHKVDAADAWDGVAGLSVGQDLSEREIQLRPPVPQFSLGKSFPNFSPFGPAVVTLDELPGYEGLRLSTVIEGHGSRAGEWKVQDGNTRNMIFSVPQIIAELSRIVTLFPGDVIFTGTPAGVGKAHGIALQPGNVLTSTVEGIGTLRNEFV
ncbi:fumarylacetoacetate hydrolase family protein [Arthrobacter zhaoxinii]|uniref:fumarylacetoacetate hydrolase family protein n=1 Tax=Arthrobacter zhaoxinii TaxID=2964616 RepID=UPI0021035AE6|nr:fumarylacetoacetate hydrolase family protein [Arthrobacter zhaoxinii]MCQ2001011.1 fumarylacetoacetate hydrolase family protein [Arthrobacter zhaoxinii]